MKPQNKNQESSKEKFLTGILTGLIRSIVLFIVIASFTGGLFILGQIIEILDLYGWKAIASLILYVCIFVSILTGIWEAISE
jgi:hypothetical protein